MCRRCFTGCFNWMWLICEYEQDSTDGMKRVTLEWTCDDVRVSLCSCCTCAIVYESSCMTVKLCAGFVCVCDNTAASMLNDKCTRQKERGVQSQNINQILPDSSSLSVTFSGQLAFCKMHNKKTLTLCKWQFLAWLWLSPKPVPILTSPLLRSVTLNELTLAAV